MTRAHLYSALALVGLSSIATAVLAEVVVGLAAPLTGSYAWAGELAQRGAEMVAADLNAAGGVLGQPVRLSLVDDYKAGTLDAQEVSRALRAHRFETVAGVIGFDAKGDVIGNESFIWNVWKAGAFVPKP